MNFLIPPAPSMEQYVRKKMQNYARINWGKKQVLGGCLEKEEKKIDPLERKIQ